MTYLTRLLLNPRSRRVQRELADPYELHRTVMKAFAADLQSDERVLFRVDLPRAGAPSLLVQSHYAPDWSNLLDPQKGYLADAAYLPFGDEPVAVKEVDFGQKLQAGQRLAFRLRANPTVKKARFDENGKALNGNRVPLIREKKQLEWLQRKITDKNAAVLFRAAITTENDLRGKLFSEKDPKKRMKFHAVQFEGMLQIDNLEAFLNMLENGIGPGKGLGFGLLSLARA